MKKILLSTLLALLTSITLNAQEITIEKDEITGEVSYLVSRNLVLSNSNKTSGFVIQPYIKLYDGKLMFAEFIVKTLNVGSDCVEKNTMIILFEDNSKYELNSWNKFNCNATSYMSMLTGLTEKLESTTIKKIRVTNGRDYNSLTLDVDDKNKSYFINILKSLKNLNNK